MIPQRWCDWLAGSMTGLAIGAWFSVLIGPAPVLSLTLATLAAVTSSIGSFLRSRIPERRP
jgi:hypothetical protein